MPIFESNDWGTNDNTPTEKPVVKPKSNFNETVGAAWNIDSVWHQSGVKARSDYIADPSFDYKTYHEDYWNVVAGARNKEHAEDLIKQYDQEKKDKEILANASFVTGLGAQALVGLSNPLNFIGLGVGGSVLGVVARAAGGAAIGTALTEPILHHNQLTRTVEDSAYNIAGAAVGGAVLGAGAHAVGAMLKPKIDVPVPTPGVPNSSAMVSGGAAAARTRTMADSQIESIPWLPQSWTEGIVRNSTMLGKFSRSANQQLMTSPFESVRNAQNVLLRSGLSTTENAKGVANAVPIEVATGQRAGDLYTKLIESDKALRDTWWAKVDSGEYDKNAILTELKKADPSLPDNYELNRTSFDKVQKMYMADSESFGKTMPEVVERVKQGADIREGLDKDKIDFGLADKGKLVDVVTGKPLENDQRVIGAQILQMEKEKVQLKADIDAAKTLKEKQGTSTYEKTDQHVALEKAVSDIDKQLTSAKLQNIKIAKENEAARAAHAVQNVPASVSERQKLTQQLEQQKAELDAVKAEHVTVAKTKFAYSDKIKADAEKKYPGITAEYEALDQELNDLVDDDTFPRGTPKKLQKEFIDNQEAQNADLDAPIQESYDDHIALDNQQMAIREKLKVYALKEMGAEKAAKYKKYDKILNGHLYSKSAPEVVAYNTNVDKGYRLRHSVRMLERKIAQTPADTVSVPHVTTPAPVDKPSIDTAALIAERQAHADNLKNLPLREIPPAKTKLQLAQEKLKAHSEKMNDLEKALEKAKNDFDNIIPDSKLHKFAYEDGSHYLSRMFDKGRIMGDPQGFENALMDGWKARNPDLDWADPDLVDALKLAATKARQKIMGEEQGGTLGEMMKNLDLPGNYIKDRTLAIDDRFLSNWTHDDVLSTEMHHISQAVVDVELARANVKYEDLMNAIDTEFAQKVTDLNTEFGVGSKTATTAISKLAAVRDADKAELKYAMQRLKRQSPADHNPTAQTVKNWEKRFNKIAGMAQLGSSALPNSLGDVASVARSFGTGRIYKIIAKTFSKEFRDDIAANAKQMGVLSDLVDRTVREAHYGDIVADSMNPNKGFKGSTEQAFDRGLEKVGDVFAKVSLIDGWSKAGRTIASIASTDNILTAAAKGWEHISPQTRTELAKFYIDEKMLKRIAEQAALHAEDLHGVKFAGTEKWTDAEAARVFQASVFAHTEHALNIPSIGSGSKFMVDTFAGRLLNRYKSFNNSAHESTFLSSMQNREYSRIATGTMNYAFWGFAGVYAYDLIAGRNHSMEKYFGDSDKATLTAWKVLMKGGFVATGTDAFVTLAKLAGAKKSPLHDAVREVFPKSLEDEIFPKWAEVSTADKMLGPTWGYLGKAWDTSMGVLDGDITDKDIHNFRTLLPGQNIGWLRRGIDYAEEALGGYKADRNANR